MPLNDKEIIDRCNPNSSEPMISPFYEDQIKRVAGEPVISFGTTSFGYDMRIGNKFKIFVNRPEEIIDPKNFDESLLRDEESDDYVLIPPNSYLLGYSIEKFNIPRDILGVALGKSTLARCGLAINVTPLEPGWKGHLTIEISNATKMAAKIYANEGCGQIVFLQGNPCGISYADRKGKYQNQEAIAVPSRLK